MTTHGANSDTIPCEPLERVGKEEVQAMAVISKDATTSREHTTATQEVIRRIRNALRFTVVAGVADALATAAGRRGMQAWKQGANTVAKRGKQRTALETTCAEFLEQLHEADGRAGQGAQSALFVTQQRTARSQAGLQLTALERRGVRVWCPSSCVFLRLTSARRVFLNTRCSYSVRWLRKASTSTSRGFGSRVYFDTFDVRCWD